LLKLSLEPVAAPAFNPRIEGRGPPRLRHGGTPSTASPSGRGRTQPSMPSENGAGGTAPSNPLDGNTCSAASAPWRDAFHRVHAMESPAAWPPPPPLAPRPHPPASPARPAREGRPCAPIPLCPRGRHAPGHTSPVRVPGVLCVGHNPTVEP